MSLRDEMALYTELTGEDGTRVPIGQLGHFLWGYEIGVEKGRPKGEWIKNAKGWIGWKCNQCGRPNIVQDNFCPTCGAEMRGEHEE